MTHGLAQMQKRTQDSRLKGESMHVCVDVCVQVPLGLTHQSHNYHHHHHHHHYHHHNHLMALLTPSTSKV
jgi:hypothetical protein